MSWKDLLQTPDERIVVPWVGGRSIRTRDRVWSLRGRQPPAHGWHIFRPEGRKAVWVEATEAPVRALTDLVRGYLVGDRLVPDGVRVDPDIAEVVKVAEPVHLIEEGLDRFVRVVAGRFCEDGPLVYDSQDFPLGPEEEALEAYFDERPNLNAVKGVTPGLEAAFRLESFRRAEIERLRKEAEERRRQEEAERARQERIRQIQETLGDGEARRILALEDFEAGARAALAVGGAQYLDYRDSAQRGEFIVRFRLDGRRFECVCDPYMRIIDSGICLTDHDSGEKGDTYFSLESLPSVIREAQRNGVLVVYRHV